VDNRINVLAPRIKQKCKHVIGREITGLASRAAASTARTFLPHSQGLRSRRYKRSHAAPTMLTGTSPAADASSMTPTSAFDTCAANWPRFIRRPDGIGRALEGSTFVSHHSDFMLTANVRSMTSAGP
jgi:hypothetical protein